MKAVYAEWQDYVRNCGLVTSSKHFKDWENSRKAQDDCQALFDQNTEAQRTGKITKQNRLEFGLLLFEDA